METHLLYIKKKLKMLYKSCNYMLTFSTCLNCTVKMIALTQHIIYLFVIVNLVNIFE